MKYHLLITDCESTGLSPEHEDELCQLACMPVETTDFRKFKEIGDPVAWYVKPECKIKHMLFSPELEAEIFSSKDTPVNVADSFVSYLDGLKKKHHFDKLIFAGWNCQFDWRFLQQWPYDRCIKYFDYHLFDAYVLSQRFLMCKKLDEAAKYFNISRKSKFHDSIEDILLTLTILQKMSAYDL